MWDCESRVELHDLDGQTIVSQPLPFGTAADPGGSWYDGASHVVGGVDGNCSPEGGSRVDPLYESLLIEQPGVSANAKRETTFAFEFHNDRAASYTRRILDDPHRPPNLGINALNGAGLVSGVVGADRLGPGWQSQSIITQGNAVIGDPDTSLIAEPTYYTYYARVSNSVLATGAFLPGSSRPYGMEQCGTNTEGIHNGMDCDIEHWWAPEYGASEMPRATWTGQPIGARLGDYYQLRDVDCYEQNAIGNTGVVLTAWAATQCPPTPDYELTEELLRLTTYAD